MTVLVLGRDDVRALLPIGECIEVMAAALRALAAGDAVQPLRTALHLPGDRGLLALMPASRGGSGGFGLKAVSVVHDNERTAFDTHLGAVLLFDGEHGRPIAVLDARAITAIRTAAVSGLATRLLAREDAGDLALLGSGQQARTHLEAMRAVRDVRRVRVWSRDSGQARRLAARATERCGIEVEVVATPRAAVAGADLICTTTAARTPILEGAWLVPGAHVNAVGACVPTARELDTEAVRRALLFTDRRESLLAEGGDFVIPLRAGELEEDHLRGELGELLLGRVAGRQGAGDVTLFKSLGLGIEDVAAGFHVYERARADGRGVTVTFGERRDDDE